MNRAIAFAACLLLSYPAYAQGPQDDVDFKPGKFSRRGDGLYTMRYGLTNITSSLISTAFVECAAVSTSGDVQATTLDSVVNVRPNETAYGEIRFSHSEDISKDADFKCRVSDVSH